MYEEWNLAGFLYGNGVRSVACVYQGTVRSAVRASEVFQHVGQFAVPLQENGVANRDVVSVCFPV